MSSDDAGQRVDESTQWERVGGTWLRILRFAPDRSRAPRRLRRPGWPLSRAPASPW